jgi:RNA polymerase sigma factor (sigma-70 family)
LDGGVGHNPATMAHSGAGGGREDVLARVRARVLGYAVKRLQSPADAEDLTQEAMVLLATKYAHVAAPEELVAVGLRIVSFKCRAFWRKATRRRMLGESPSPDPADESLDAPSSTPDPEEMARTRQRLAMLVEAAARLEGRCRQILRRKLEGASLVEMAAEFGRPVNTVYSWDYRCHQKLKTLLAERWAFVSGVSS